MSHIPTQPSLPDLILEKKTFPPVAGRLEKLRSEEIVIALCGPIGTPLHTVSELLADRLKAIYNYPTKVLKLSNYIKEKGNTIPTTLTPIDRKKAYIKEGNTLREKYGLEVLAELAIYDMSYDRTKLKLEQKSTRHEPRRTCYIIDSVKNRHELTLLRKVYGSLLYFVGVFSPLETREKFLGTEHIDQKDIGALIDQDSGEELDNGQKVRETFHEADFFLKIESNQSHALERQIERFLNIILGDKVVTPSKHEQAMQQAASAAALSACLSRQVGAAITDKDGNLLGVGWNDVPKFGGGLYASEDFLKGNDNRCSNLQAGICHNDHQKLSIAGKIADYLITSKVITEEYKSQLTLAIISSPIKDLIEFSRAVHAEMLAIINACTLGGERIRGGRLYCTTYPCHSCARHIVASGISEVYFIEPYKKSLATFLHGDSITEKEGTTTKVQLLAFEGVAPRRFDDLFRMSSNGRKNKDGKMIKKRSQEAEPEGKVSLESIPSMENIVLKSLLEKKLIKENEMLNENQNDLGDSNVVPIPTTAIS